ncbi:hypothetical protein Aeqsu_0043 [Aequorivita sublithincola DSM 14238]|uniref:DUF922 domain-containing protein n=1 Tax=Aequorivita sublithincola (strain DSM 14238 / LMG 21431 / ACAM 643 / 9-3) TaxID=746697 RepID=I3YRF7_AEQSU|nr:DUF922 domain-containing protein [Aequorivita sublithincola]AFL79575.1 hypothetical protein Aeqsu_0043 [Aequorivita sublithincola DSM 14238]
MKLLFTFIFSLIFFPQNISEKIIWNENQKLSWEDFRGKPNASASFVATTNSGISFHYSYSTKNGVTDVEYSVESFFTPEGSWYIPNRVNPHILKHEQAHFDISELHARMLRKNIAGKKFTKNVKPVIEAIYQKVEQNRRAMQTKFDAETDHSRNEAKEAFWQTYIAQQLADYESWK